MRLFVQVLAAIVALTFAAAIGLLLYLAFADLGEYKTDIEEGVLDATGFELEIGEFDLDVGGQTIMTASQVVVNNPEYPAASRMAALGRLHVVIDTWSILRNEVDVEVFELSNVVVSLHQQEDGKANWQATPRQAEIPVPTEDTDQAELILHALNLQNVIVSYESAGQEIVSIELDSLVLDRQLDGSTEYTFSGQLNADPIRTPVSGAGVHMTEGSRSRFSAGTISVEGGELGLDGWLDPSGEELEAAFSVTAEGDSLASLGESIAVSGLPAQPFDMSVDINTIPSGIALQDLALVLGEGELGASISMQFGGARPTIIADVNSPRLDLRSPGDEDEEEADEQVTGDASAEESGPVFSDEPLEFSFLDAADIEADISVGSVLLDNGTLTDAAAKVILSDGVLTVDPLGFHSRDGELSGEISLRPDGDLHVLEVDLQTSNLRFGALGAEGQDTATIPPLDAQFLLAGRGASLHEIMAGANGSLSGTQQGGQLDLQAAGVLFSDLVTSIFRAINPLAETETTTALECGIYAIDIVDGVATIEQLALQTDKLTIISSGNINLDTEIIDMTLSTKTREGFGVSLGGVVNSFLKLGGTLSAPSVGMDAAGSVTTTGAAVMTGGLSVLAKGLFDRVSAEADLCAALQDSETEAVPAE